MGCGAGSGDHSMDIARMAALDAGWSLDAPGVTLNRFCGSGQQAVNFAADGHPAPGSRTSSSPAAWSRCRRPAPLHVDGFTANNHHLRDQYNMVAQGISADLIATVEGFTREECDAARRRQPGARRGRHRRRPLRPGARADLPRRRHRSPSTTRSSPGPARPLESLAKLTPSFEAMGAQCDQRRLELHHRRDRAAGLPGIDRDPPRAPRRQLLRRGRRRRPRCSSSRPTTPRRTG